MRDHLIRATALEGKVRAFAVQTTELAEEMRRRHGMMPTAAAALGRTATAAAMMGAMLKGKEKLTVQIKGNGPLGSVVVDANARGEVRGYIDHPQTDLPLNAKGKLDVAGAIGEGFMYVVKDMGLKEPYRGSTPIVSGEIAEDFTYYFAKSEQTPSAVALGVLVNTDLSVKASGGFIIQLLPGLTDEEIGVIEKHLAGLQPFTSLLDEGKTLEEILTAVIGPVDILGRMEVSFQCQCSRDRVERTLLSLGRDELQEILDEEGKAEVVCHFCNEKYGFFEQDLIEVMGRLDP